MAALAAGRIAELLSPYVDRPSQDLVRQLSIYLEMLLKWNSHTNLTAIREPERIVTTHFGESLFAASRLPPGRTLLDYGSGAGFPGLPIQLARRDLVVTLAESQNKKAAFLREVVRQLGLETEVWPRRVEALPKDRRFDLVTLRAVDDPEEALRKAQERVVARGYVVHLGISSADFESKIPVPQSLERFLLFRRC